MRSTRASRVALAAWKRAHQAASASRAVGGWPQRRHVVEGPLGRASQLQATIDAESTAPAGRRQCPILPRTLESVGARCPPARFAARALSGLGTLPARAPREMPGATPVG